MSNDVLISKELRDRICDILNSFEMSDSMRDCFKSLRAAPETVSLEGVKRWDPVIEEGNATYDTHPTGALILFSDAELLVRQGLNRLVASVQPSAVVSREEFEKWLANKNTATNGERFWAREVFGFLTHGGRYD